MNSVGQVVCSLPASVAWRCRLIEPWVRQSADRGELVVTARRAGRRRHIEHILLSELDLRSRHQVASWAEDARTGSRVIHI